MMLDGLALMILYKKKKKTSMLSVKNQFFSHFDELSIRHEREISF